MSDSPSIIRVRLNMGIVSARVVKENEKTVWVELKDGNIIKRHKEKHVVYGSLPGETTEAK